MAIIALARCAALGLRRLMLLVLGFDVVGVVGGEGGVVFVGSVGGLVGGGAVVGVGHECCFWVGGVRLGVRLGVGVGVVGLWVVLRVVGVGGHCRGGRRCWNCSVVLVVVKT